MGKTGVAVHQAFQLVTSYIFHFLFQRTDLILHVQNVLLSGHQFLINSVMPVNVLVLCQITDLLIFSNNYLSGIGGNLLHNNTKESGFSCAVIANQGGLFPFFYVKGSILQDYFFPKGFADALT